jgi:hypothetical protein
MANYGSQGRGEETIPDWLLGNRKWRLLDRLSDVTVDGWRAEELAGESQCSIPTTYEFLRVLRPTGAISVSERRYALDPDHSLAAVLLGLVVELRRYDAALVDRPQRRR